MVAAIGSLPWWSWAAPAVSWVLLIAGLVLGVAPPLAIACTLSLFITVFAAVHHAEVVAHRVGEPFGTLVLAVAVTVIEVALIVSVMAAAPDTKAGLARDTVYAAVMIVCNGIVGLSLLFGGARHHEQGFSLSGASAALAVLAPLTVLSLILPNVTSTTDGPTFSPAQLIFAAVTSLVLYGSFVFVQTVRHRDYFLPDGDPDETHHAPPPSPGAARIALALLIASLVAVVVLAKVLTPSLEEGLDYLSAPKALVGVIIAAVVLLPEGLAALRAAQANRLQTSLNLALGSALASIGLTIPTVAAAVLLLGWPLQLGLGNKEAVMLALTLLLSVITLGTGRTTVLQGIVHLVMFASFLFFVAVP